MKLTYPHHPTNPIISTEDFLKRRSMALATQDWRDFNQSLPHIQISQCPYCSRTIWMKAGLIFSLTDNFWFRPYSDGREDVVTTYSLCEHVFCVDGALNLQGHQPTEAKKWYDLGLGQDWNYILMASEVPFVKPRVLQLPTMKAVIHSISIADSKYTAYPMVYFAKQYPKKTDYCVPWATKKYMAYSGSGFYIVGTRADAQDYALESWIRQGKLCWLIPGPEEYVFTHTPIEAFPYKDVPGRRHPYSIRNGKIHDLPQPEQGEAKYKHWEH